MQRVIRVEALKLVWMPMTAGLLLGAAALSAVFAAVSASAPAGRVSELPSVTGLEGQEALFGSGAAAASFALVLGVLFTAGEHRHGTIVTTFLATPRRGRVLTAKALVVFVAGTVFGTVAATIALGAGRFGLALQDVKLLLSAGDVAALAAGTVAATALAGVLGAGVGALVREQVPAVAGCLVLLYVVDPLLSSWLDAFARFGPGGATKSLTGGSLDDPLGPGAALAMLSLYAGLAVAACLLGRNRDVG